MPAAQGPTDHKMRNWGACGCASLLVLGFGIIAGVATYMVVRFKQSGVVGPCQIMNLTYQAQNFSGGCDTPHGPFLLGSVNGLTPIPTPNYIATYTVKFAFSESDFQENVTLTLVACNLSPEKRCWFCSDGSTRCTLGTTEGPYSCPRFIYQELSFYNATWQEINSQQRRTCEYDKLNGNLFLEDYSSVPRNWLIAAVVFWIVFACSVRCLCGVFRETLDPLSRVLDLPRFSIDNCQIYWRSFRSRANQEVQIQELPGGVPGAPGGVWRAFQ
jgi:hypothetical protein